MNIQDLINSATGQQIISNVSQQFGLEQSQASAAVQSALPMLLGGLGRNAQDPQGAAALHNALEQHDPSVLNNIQGFFGSRESAISDGSKILKHIFGNNVEDVQTGISKSSGISTSKIGPILAMLAPLVLSYLNKAKQSNNISQPSGLGDLIGGLAGGLSGNNSNAGGGLIGMVSSFLDKNKDGNVIDDIIGMFSKR